LAALVHTTKITFYVEEEIEPKQDYLEIVLTVKTQETSLKSAFINAEQSLKFVIDSIEKYCVDNSKKKGECK